MKIYSWNVNSLRSNEGKFLSFMEEYSPDILFIQELRATVDQLSFFLKFIPGYKALFNSSSKAGYAGTALYYKDNLDIKEINTYGDYMLGIDGRLISFYLNNIFFVGLYSPNGTMSEDRQKFKIQYLNGINKLIIDNLKNHKDVVLCGDFNIAVDERDLYAPVLNKNHSGFLPEDRLWAKDLLGSGMLDTFRLFEKKSGFYTWWHMRDKERKENKGWRFDYIFISNSLKNRISSANILKNVFGSDHCPIFIDISI